MAVESFILFDDVLVEAAGLNLEAGVQKVALSSTPILNGPTPRSSLRLEINYGSVDPDWTAGWPSFAVGAVVEAKDANDNWFPLAYQFNPYRNTEQASKRILLMQPDLSDFNSGADESIIPIFLEEARVSRQQGFLPDSEFRLCIVITDNDPAGPSAFKSVRISASGERYDHAS